MKNYILTEHERNILRKFLESGAKETGFKVALYRIRRNYKPLKEDMRLISETLEKNS